MNRILVLSFFELNLIVFFLAYWSCLEILLDYFLLMYFQPIDLRGIFFYRKFNPIAFKNKMHCLLLIQMALSLWFFIRIIFNLKNRVFVRLVNKKGYHSFKAADTFFHFVCHLLTIFKFHFSSLDIERARKRKTSYDKPQAVVVWSNDDHYW